MACLSFWHAIGCYSTWCGRFTSFYLVKQSLDKQFLCWHSLTVTLCQPQKVKRIQNKGAKFKKWEMNEWMVSASDSVIASNRNLEWDICVKRVTNRVCFALTSRSLCAWSPASCTWSSRSSSRRSWTGQRSSGTWLSSCPQAEESVEGEPAGSTHCPHWILALQAHLK